MKGQPTRRETLRRSDFSSEMSRKTMTAPSRVSPMKRGDAEMATGRSEPFLQRYT